MPYTIPPTSPGNNGGQPAGLGDWSFPIQDDLGAEAAAKNSGSSAVDESEYGVVKQIIANPRTSFKLMETLRDVVIWGCNLKPSILTEMIRNCQLI
jgi:hypothetical protein